MKSNEANNINRSVLYSPFLGAFCLIHHNVALISLVSQLIPKMHSFDVTSNWYPRLLTWSLNNLHEGRDTVSCQSAMSNKLLLSWLSRATISHSVLACTSKLWSIKCYEMDKAILMYSIWPLPCLTGWPPFALIMSQPTRSLITQMWTHAEGLITLKSPGH